MQFDQILGQQAPKQQLLKSVTTGRIPHAQLFVGPEGSGTLAAAIAYARAILCGSENAACNLKFDSLSHPDLHFVYPTVTNDDIKKNPRSIDFLSDWREFVSAHPYGSLFDWYQALGIKNQQGEIRVADAQEILRSMSLKAFEGGYKITIIWAADKLNTEASNKILKILEEPTPQTLFILIAEKEEDLLPTIRSRCQVVRFLPLPEQEIADALQKNQDLNPREATLIARQSAGNYNKALHLLAKDGEDVQFEEWFVIWVRAAFRAKGNAAAISDLISWSDTIAGLGRETQKKFLSFCMDMFRQALLLNYQVTPLVYFEPKIEKFKLENFAPFVNNGNISDIYKEISDATYHIERNANPKIVLTDLSIKLTRLIHKK